MNNQSKSVFHLHNSLTVIVALGWFYLYRIYEPDLRQNFNLLGLLDLFRFFRLYASVLSDVFRESNYIPFLRDVFGGLNFIPFCYFLIIPLGLITIRLWSRGLPASNSRFRRIYYVVAKIFVITSWPPLAMPSIIIVGSSLWPYSLFQGPDTGWARCGFRKTFGFTPPAIVKGIHYYEAVTFVGSASTLLKFQFEDEGVVDKIVNDSYLELIPRNEINSSNSTVPEARHVSWWPKQIVAKSQEVYGYRSKHDNAESKLRLSLWIDRENKIAYHYKEGH